MILRPPSLNARGQSAVEFAFALAFLLAMLFIIWDMTKICYHWVSLNMAVDKAGRYGKTVQETVRAGEVEAEVIRVAGGLGIALADGDVTIETEGTTMQINATHNVSVTPLTGLLFAVVGDYGTNFTVSVTEVIQNETFGDLVWT